MSSLVGRGLNDPRPEVRLSVVDALTRSKAARASNLLHRALEDSAASVRFAANFAVSLRESVAAGGPCTVAEESAVPGFSQETLSLSDAEFKILRDLIRERTGIHYESDRRDILADKLSGRAIERGFESFVDYYYLLKYEPEAAEEWRHVLDALSVPETYCSARRMDQVRAAQVDVIVLPEFRRGGRPRSPCASGARGVRSHRASR